MLCEKTGIGVISTFMAKGCIDMDDDYCLYTVGLGTKDRMNFAIDGADVVLALGFDMVEYHPRLWNPSKTKTIIHADFLPAEIDECYHPQVEVVGDLGHVLWMPNERVNAATNLQFDLSNQSNARAVMKADLEEYKDDDQKGRIWPQKVIWDGRAVLGPNDIPLSDVDAHKMWIARHYHCHEPNTRLIPNGFCSMGLRCLAPLRPLWSTRIVVFSVSAGMPAF